MVFRRGRKKRRSPAKKAARKSFRRQFRKAPIGRQPVQMIKRKWVTEQSVNFDGTPADLTPVFTFALSDLPNYTEFTNLWDQYMLAAVKLAIVPRYNVVTQESAGDAATKVGDIMIYSVIDYNDSSVLTSRNDALQYQSCKATPGRKVHKRYLKPKYLSQIYESAVTTGYSSKRGFLATTDPSVPHYAVKTYWHASDDTGVIGNVKFDVVMTYYLMLKTVK